MEERPPFYYDPHSEGNRVRRNLEKDIEESLDFFRENWEKSFIAYFSQNGMNHG